jgi:hypothetical protein
MPQLTPPVFRILISSCFRPNMRSSCLTRLACSSSTLPAALLPQRRLPAMPEIHHYPMLSARLENIPTPRTFQENLSLLFRTVSTCLYGPCCLFVPEALPYTWQAFSF